MRRGSKVGVTLLVIVVLLVGAAVIADRIAVNAAEDRIATEAGNEMAARNITTAGRAEVHIGGFPFLTQVLAGKYRKITIDVPRPETNGVQLDSLRVVATDVRADTRAVMNGTGDVTAGRVVGTGTMNWDEVREALQIAGVPGVDPSAVQLSVVDNRVEMRLPLAVLGQQLILRATGSLRVADGAVRFQLDTLGTAEGQAPAAVQRLIDQYRNLLKVTVKLPDMPYQMVVNRVQTSAAGVLMTASTENVKLNG